MSKKSLDEKNNDYISYKSSKIAFCQDGRIFLTDKDTEFVGLRDCENCKQKDQRIADLEKQLENATKEIDNLEFQLREQYQNVDKLEITVDILFELKQDLIRRIRQANKENKDLDIWLSIYDTEQRNKYLEQAEESLKKLEGKRK